MVAVPPVMVETERYGVTPTLAPTGTFWKAIEIGPEVPLATAIGL